MWYFSASVALLTLLLFFPVGKLVWVLNVRRLERRTNGAFPQTEIQGQLHRARSIGGFPALLFSLLYNLHRFGGWLRG
jgi:hypothetical protein